MQECIAVQCDRSARIASTLFTLFILSSLLIRNISTSLPVVTTTRHRMSAHTVTDIHTHTRSPPMPCVGFTALIVVSFDALLPLFGVFGVKLVESVSAVGERLVFHFDLISQSLIMSDTLRDNRLLFQSLVASTQCLPHILSSIL